MAIKIVVGGPPQSGKSTFTTRLVRTLLKERGVDVDNMGLDPWDRTLDVILERIPESERKQNMSKKEAIEALRKKASSFNKLSKKHDVVVGDLPGIPDELAQIVTRIGTYGIIVIDNDKDELIGAAGRTSGSHQRVKPEDIFNLKLQMPTQKKNRLFQFTYFRELEKNNE